MTATSEGITLLGSEMLTWSDLDGEAGAFGGLLAARLVGTGRGHVLVAGPTAAEVVTEIAGSFARADVLVRSWLDAHQLREALSAEIGLYCGPLDRMPRPDAGYDAVVALAGIDRLHSAEQETPSWRRTLAALAGLLAPDGELYLGIGNPVGVDRMLSLSPSTRHHDADWPEGHLAETDLPTAAAVRGLLADEHDLAAVETWFCHGSRSAPWLAANAAALEGRAGDPVLLGAVAHAYEIPDVSAPPLKDPTETVRDLVRAGLGAATAPLTVLHLRHGAPAPQSAPVALVQEQGDGRFPAVAYRLTHDGDGWTRALLGESAARSGDGLVRDTALLDGPVPEGESLADLLARACREHDLAVVGALVRRYRDWLGDAADAEVPAERVPVTLRRLVLGAEGLEVLDPSFRAADGAPRDVVLLRALLDFACALQARGARHPWSVAASPRLLATSLVAAAGIEADEELHAAAAALDVALHGEARDLTSPATVPASYAELAELVESLGRRAAESDEHVLWVLQRLQTRQRTIRKTRAKVRELSGSREYRVGRRIFWVRDLLRRRAQRREEAGKTPTGQWRTKKDERPEDARIEVESDLFPPGYVPDESRIEVLPPQGDGSELEKG